MTYTDADKVPAWVHMADVPPTDEEPWPCAEPCDCLPDGRDRTRLAVLALILAVLVLLTIAWWD